jgi:hypothetical protein
MSRIQWFEWMHSLTEQILLFSSRAILIVVVLGFAFLQLTLHLIQMDQEQLLEKKLHQFQVEASLAPTLYEERNLTLSRASVGYAYGVSVPLVGPIVGPILGIILGSHLHSSI